MNRKQFIFTLLVALVSGLMGVIEDGETKPSDQIRGYDLLGRRLGLWTDREDQATGAIPDTRPVEDMTLGELRDGIALMREAQRLADGQASDGPRPALIEGEVIDGTE